MHKYKTFSHFMFFIAAVVVPMAILYLMLTGRMNNLSTTQAAAIGTYIVTVWAVVFLKLVKWLTKP